MNTDATDSVLSAPSAEFTHKIIGLAYQIYNELGYGYQEKYYQRAFALLLEKEKISYEKELVLPIKFNNVPIGRYFIDFKIENNLLIEFKVASDFYLKYIKQVLAYLKFYKLKLGLLILFTKDGVKIKRIIN